MDMIDGIRTRRSVREFTKEEVPEDLVETILEAGTWAPSGKNNQPWRFAVIREETIRKEISELTHYGAILRRAPLCIAVFLDHAVSYDRTKDVQAIGACIQNMLLAAHSLGLGGVWLGEILKNKDRVGEILGAGSSLELMAVLAIGHPTKGKREGSRKGIEEVLFFRR